MISTIEIEMLETVTDLTLADIPIWRMNPDAYLERIRRGTFTPEDRLELLESMVVAKMTKNQPHVVTQDLCLRLFNRLLPDGWFVSFERPVRTVDSLPEPDISIVRGNPRDYPDAPTLPGQIGLVIEVADSTLQTDRRLKVRVYGRAGIGTYWIINLAERGIEVYTDPFTEGEAAGYRLRTSYPATSQIPLILDGQPIAKITVGDLLP